MITTKVFAHNSTWNNLLVCFPLRVLEHLQRIYKKLLKQCYIQIWKYIQKWTYPDIYWTKVYENIVFKLKPNLKLYLNNVSIYQLLRRQTSIVIISFTFTRHSGGIWTGYVLCEHYLVLFPGEYENERILKIDQHLKLQQKLNGVLFWLTMYYTGS